MRPHRRDAIDASRERAAAAPRRHRSAQVQITMEGVCIMLDEKPDWPTAKKVLGDSQFLQNLKTYDKDNIPEPTIKKLQKHAAASRDAIDATRLHLTRPGVVSGPSMNRFGPRRASSRRVRERELAVASTASSRDRAAATSSS